MAAFQAVQPGATLALAFGRGVGKSYLQRMIWWTQIAREPTRVILLTPSYKQAIDTYARAVQNELRGDWSFLGGEVNKSRWRIEFHNGSWVQFFGAENIQAARGMRCDIVSPDECDDIEINEFEDVCIPWLSEPRSKKIIVATGTPKRGRHGLLHKLFTHEGAFALRATYREAPGQISQEYVEETRRMISPERFAREWEASFEAREGLVYNFDERVHVLRTDEGPWTEVLIGVDWGWEDPGVFVVIGVRGSGKDATAHVIEEIYEQHQPLSWWVNKAKALRETYPRARWFADPSQPAAIDALKRDAGVSIVAGNNKIEDGIAVLGDWFDTSSMLVPGRRRLVVAPKCKSTIRELQTYRRKRDPRDRDRTLETPEDKNNHSCDALRYAMLSRFGKYDPVRGTRNDFIL